MEQSLEALMQDALESENVEFDAADENHVIDSLTDRYTLLNNTRQQIDSTGGVSRNDIQDLVDECELALPEEAPINSFTEAPSQTNFAVAVESILETTKAVLRTIIQKVKEILRKIFDYLVKLLDPVFRESKNYVKLRDNFKLLFATEEELTKLMAKSGIVVPTEDDALTKELGEENKAIYDRYTDEIKHCAMQWQEGYNAFVAAAMKRESPYMNALRAAIIASDHGFRQLVSKIKLLAAIAAETHRDPNSPGVQNDILTKLQSVSEDIDLSAFKAAVSLTEAQHPHGAEGLKEVADTLHAEAMKLEGEKSEPQDMMDVAYLFANDRHPFEELPVPAEKILNDIRIYRELVDTLQASTPKEDDAGKIIRAYNDAARKVLSEFLAFQLIVSDGVKVNRVLYWTLMVATKYTYAAINRHILLSKALGKKEEQAEFEKILNNLRSKLKPF